MKPRAFIAQLALALAVIVVFNVLVARAARNMPARKVVERSLTTPGATLAHGNSTMAAAMNPAAYTAASPTREPLVDIALGATIPVDHLILANFALGANKPRRVIYGFYSFQLFDPPTNSWRQFSGNRAVSLHLDPAAAARHSGRNSFIDSTMIHLTAAIPALLERDVIWAKVERERRGLAELGLAKKAASNRFGRVEDFAAMGTLKPDDLARAIDQIISTGADFSEPIREMFDAIQKADVELVVVAMPASDISLPTQDAKDKWREFTDYVRGKLQARNARLIDASFWFSDQAVFEDALHLNERGAEVFSARLAQTIEQR